MENMGHNAREENGPASQKLGPGEDDPQSAILRRAVQVAKVANVVDRAARKVKHHDEPTSAPSSTEAMAPTEVNALMESEVTAGNGAAPQTDTPADSRIAAMEMHIDANNWKGVAEILGGPAEFEKLPPGLMLVAALACSESSAEGSTAAITAAGKAVAHLLDVPETSPLARVISRRLLRKNPVRLRDREAPNGKVTSFILFGTILLGAGIGWLATGGGSTLWTIVRAAWQR